jgi:hypothetical protein
MNTGVLENGAMDSDSVNLGSNPSPPATQIAEKFGLFVRGRIGLPGLSEQFGRTEAGTADGEVYFISDGDLIKIGWSGAPEVRRQALEVRCKTPLRLLGAVAGHMDDERAIHERFAHLRRHGEWFRPDPELDAFIAAIGSFRIRWTQGRPRVAKAAAVNPVAPDDPAEQRRVMHADLNAILAAHPGRADVAGRVRIARHSLRDIAEGDEAPEIMCALAATIADLHRVTREGA